MALSLDWVALGRPEGSLGILRVQGNLGNQRGLCYFILSPSHRVVCRPLATPDLSKTLLHDEVSRAPAGIPSKLRILPSVGSAPESSLW